MQSIKIAVFLQCHLRDTVHDIFTILDIKKPDNRGLRELWQTANGHADSDPKTFYLHLWRPLDKIPQKATQRCDRKCPFRNMRYPCDFCALFYNLFCKFA